MNINVLTPYEVQPVLSCQNLRKRYSGGVFVLDGLNLELKSGRIAGLLGPNGSGKTTLIKIIAGLLTPDSGTVSVDGHAIGSESKKIVSYLPDRISLDDWMTVGGLLDMFADFYADFSKERAAEMLDHLQIPLKVKLRTLSKGTKEKVQLILVMSRDARLYLLDEPIGGVDPAAREYILRTILTNYNENSSILISTHLISDVETVLDDVFFISGGKISLSSTADDIKQKQGKSVDELFREVYRC